jgi:TonB family protein
VIAPAVVDVVAAAPTPAPAAPPAAVGPFFETRDVSESPRIATRAEPRLPTGMKDRAIKEMVVVRALVSQSGHPSRVSLLRRSKSGPELDDVVVAAVNHWTFAPAKKKGEPVSCWFNFAVEVGGTE